MSTQQDEIQDQIVKALGHQLVQYGVALLKAGQRAGKSVISHKLVHAQDGTFSTIVLVNMGMPDICLAWKNDHHDMYNDSRENIVVMTVDDIVKQFDVELEEWLEEESSLGTALFIMEEPFWVADSFSVFERIRKISNVFVIGTRGPYFETGWQFVPGLSFATWEINPNVTRSECEATCTDPMIF